MKEGVQMESCNSQIVSHAVRVMMMMIVSVWSDGLFFYRLVMKGSAGFCLHHCH